MMFGYTYKLYPDQIRVLYPDQIRVTDLPIILNIYHLLVRSFKIFSFFWNVQHRMINLSHPSVP